MSHRIAEIGDIDMTSATFPPGLKLGESFRQVVDLALHAIEPQGHVFRLVGDAWRHVSFVDAPQVVIRPPQRTGDGRQDHGRPSPGLSLLKPSESSDRHAGTLGKLLLRHL
jgi:hypothetical protein